MSAPATGWCVVESSTRPLNGPASDPACGASGRTRNGALRTEVSAQAASTKQTEIATNLTTVAGRLTNSRRALQTGPGPFPRPLLAERLIRFNEGSDALFNVWP